MASMVLNTADLFEFDRLYSHTSVNDTFRCYHPQAGPVEIRNFGFSHMQVMEIEWDTAQDIELHDLSPTDGISINFMLEGSVHSAFRGLKHDLNMRARTHNLIHTPEVGHINCIKGGQIMSSLLIGIDKEFFASSIGQSDAWSERIVDDIYHDRPFSGIQGELSITPQMLYLIDGIRNCKATGSMRNLLIQSRVLELVALEIEQFKKPVGVSETMPVEEVEKLHQLKSYLEANFLEEHTLATLSRYCLLNEFKVKKGFRQLFDTTVFNYLRKLRMEHAGQLLRNCSLSVDEVADRLGYEHSQHFSIAFKKYTGLTPSQYQHGTITVFA